MACAGRAGGVPPASGPPLRRAMRPEADRAFDLVDVGEREGSPSHELVVDLLVDGERLEAIEGHDGRKVAARHDLDPEPRQDLVHRTQQRIDRPVEQREDHLDLRVAVHDRHDLLEQDVVARSRLVRVVDADLDRDGAVGAIRAPRLHAPGRIDFELEVARALRDGVRGIRADQSDEDRQRGEGPAGQALKADVDPGGLVRPRQIDSMGSLHETSPSRACVGSGMARREGDRGGPVGRIAGGRAEARERHGCVNGFTLEARKGAEGADGQRSRVRAGRWSGSRASKEGVPGSGRRSRNPLRSALRRPGHPSTPRRTARPRSALRRGRRARPDRGPALSGASATRRSGPEEWQRARSSDG